MALVACVTFMLVKDKKILAEKRKRTKNVAPGAVALPGDALATLDLDVDRIAVHEFLRVYRR